MATTATTVTPAAIPLLPPLTSAAVVVGPTTKGESVVPPAIARLPHVAALVSDFLDHGTLQFWSISRACEYNHVAMLPRLADRTTLSTEEKVIEAGKGLLAAVVNDNLEVIEWLHAYCPRADTRSAIEFAARAGKLSLLQWITDNFACVTWSPTLAKSATMCGNLEMLQWIWLHPSMSSSFFEYIVVQNVRAAALKGHLAVVKWLSEHSQWSRDDDDTSCRFATILLDVVRHLEGAKYISQFGVSQYCHASMLSIANTTSQDPAMAEWIRGLPKQRDLGIMAVEKLIHPREK